MESSINNFQDGKVMLTLAEAASYMSLSKSYLYKLVCWGEIVHYKPGGKRVYFHIDDVVAWLQRNRIPSRDELERRAERYVSQSKVKWSGNNLKQHDNDIEPVFEPDIESDIKPEFVLEKEKIMDGRGDEGYSFPKF